MLLFIKNSQECRDAVTALRAKEADNYIVYIHAHGSDKEDLFDVLKTMDETEYIFLTELASAMQEAMDAGKSIYVVGLSCYWNLRYDWGIPTPTVSVGPDTKSRLPYSAEVVENSLRNHLAGDVNKALFLDWAQSLQKAFECERSRGIWECHSANGELNTCAKLRIIERQ